MQSPFRKYLGTNYVPTEEEADRIRAHLVAHEAALARLDVLIRNLVAHREQVKDYIRSHTALICHPRRLPLDLFQEIFQACLPTDRNATMRTTEAPLLLCRICSPWRTLALSMPRLWASLTVPANFGGHDGVVVDWLERSASIPLSISLACKWPNSVLEVSCQFSARWHKLDVSDIRVSDFLQVLAEVDAPLLTEVKMAFTDHTSDKTQVLSSKLLRSVKTITIHAARHNDLVPRAPFTWAHLTHLILDYKDNNSATGGLSVDTAYRLLRGCTHLVSVQFHLDLDPGQLQSAPSLSLPFLQSLSFMGHRFVSFNHVADLVERLDMPNLCHFQMPPSDTGSRRLMTHDSDIAFLAHLAERSPSISSIGIVPQTFTRDCLLNTLRRFPSLTSLRAICLWRSRDGANTIDLLHLLTPDPDTLATDVCLDLQELSIQTSLRFDDGIWMEFIDKRAHCGTKLRRLELEFKTDVSERIPDVQRLLYRDVDVSVKYSPTTFLRLANYIGNRW
ncbi:hypothetical protein B0H17DRAFT_989256 [Mycena rosella]|uniref:F-box domain-containing protein n=1 Tax=Mycena rosella TaxID=1033263 RepID=A0AAD7D012_MYCRO|nr:hypothetical protein B0H17DRAFT_989256 [Mycena rosella]